MGPKVVAFDRGRILSVGSRGIEYRDDDGRHCLIDFGACGDGPGNRRRCVGRRDFSASPPYFEFPTEPATRFVFGGAPVEGRPGSGDWYEDFRWLEVQLNEAGCTTIDLA